MAGALIGALRVTLGIDTAAFEEGLGIAQKRLNAAGKNLSQIGDRMAGLGKNLAIGVTAPLVAFGVSAVKAANESAEALALVNATLDSMGPRAGKTSAQLQDFAAQLQSVSTFDDDDILRNVTTNMLTFGNVAGEQFDRAQKVVLGVSTVLKQDLKSSAIQVGKALNDPVKGLAALGKVGIKFTDDQKAMIKSLVKSGDVAGAQKIILGELEAEFGKAAQAARDATPGADTIDAWREFHETVGAIIVEVLPKLTDFLTRVLDGFNKLDPGTKSFVVAAAAIAAAIGPVLVAVGALISIIGALVPVLAPVIALIGSAGLGGALAAAAIAAAPFVAAGAALAAVWFLFGDKIGPVLTALKEKLVSTLGPKLTALFDKVKSTLTELWNGPFGDAIRTVIDVLGDFFAGVGSFLGEGLIRILKALGEEVIAVLNVIVDVFTIVAALLTGDFSGAWEGVKTLVGDVVSGWLAVLKSLAPEAVQAISALVVGVQEWIGRKLTAIWDGAKDAIQGLADKFKWLWDVVVGNSYIPDLFDGIQSEAKRFEPEFVKPVKAGIDRVAGSFKGLNDLLARLFQPEAELAERNFEFDQLERAIARAEAQGKKALPTLKLLDEALERLRGENIGQGGFEIKIADPGSLVKFGDVAEQAADKRVDDLEDDQQMRDRFRQTFSDGIRAALDGDLKGFFQSWFADSGNKAFESILNSVADEFGKLLSGLFGSSGSSGGGLGGILSGALGSIFGGAPGFALGGSFTVGGRPGRDANLVAFRATRGEKVMVGNGNDLGSSRVQIVPSPYFDVVVDGRIAGAAPAIAGAGADIAGNRTAFAQSRRLA